MQYHVKNSFRIQDNESKDQVLSNLIRYWIKFHFTSTIPFTTWSSTTYNPTIWQIASFMVDSLNNFTGVTTTIKMAGILCENTFGWACK